MSLLHPCERSTDITDIPARVSALFNERFHFTQR